MDWWVGDHPPEGGGPDPSNEDDGANPFLDGGDDDEDGEGCNPFLRPTPSSASLKELPNPFVGITESEDPEPAPRTPSDDASATTRPDGNGLTPEGEPFMRSASLDPPSSNNSLDTDFSRTASLSPTSSPSGSRRKLVSTLVKRQGNKKVIGLPEWIKDHVETGSKAIRVFFSSPFGGMENERNCLTKLYFPELRVMCEKVGLTFVPIDLRWGITEEDASDALVIQICLREIEAAELFVGFYGQRYGWHGKEDELLSHNFEKAKTDYPWIEEYRERSVTEIEFIAGHFNCIGKKDASFYFRDPAYDSTMCAGAEKAGDEREIRKYKVESEEAAVKRDELRDWVYQTASQCTVRMAQYENAEMGARLMYEDLKSKLEPRIAIAALEKKNKFGDGEAVQHSVYMNVRGASFVGGKDHHATLNDHIKSRGNNALVVTGGHGTGKTSLLANWLREAQKRYPLKYLFHFVGCSSQSTSVLEILQRLAKGLAKMGGQPVDVSDMDVAALTKKLPSLLEGAAAACPMGICIVIDALDEMQPDHRAHELTWLPREFPPNVKVIVSSADPDELGKRTDWKTIKITTLPKPTLLQIMNNELKSRGKELSDVQIERIISASAHKSAFYLITLVSELCKHGDFFTLDAKIDRCLASSTPEDLLALVLERIEDDYKGLTIKGMDGKTLVAETMVALFVSRQGLTEPELQAILDMPPSIWSRLSFALDEMFMARSGLICVRRQQVLDAIRLRYCKDEKVVKAMRNRLAQYHQQLMDENGVSVRTLMELPWLYQQTADTERLRRCLTNADMFHGLCVELAAGNYDLLSYWRTVGDTPEQITEQYMSSLTKMLKDCDRTDTAAMLEIVSTCTRLGQYLAESGSFKEAMQPYQKGLAVLQEMGDTHRSKQVSILSNMARLASGHNQMAFASKCYQQALAMAQSIKPTDHVQIANIQVGLAILEKDGDPSKALGLLSAALEIYKRQLGPEHPDVGMVLHLMGEQFAKGQQEAVALKYYTQALGIRERTLGVSHPNTASSLADLGQLYLHMQNIPKALDCSQRALAIRREKLGSDHPETAVSMSNLGNVYSATRKFAEAREQYDQSLQILEDSFGKGHAATCEVIDRIADMSLEMGRVQDALEFYERALAIKERSLGADSPALANTCYNMAQIYVQREQLPEALAHITRVHAIAEKAFGADHPLAVESKEKRDALTEILAAKAAKE